MKKVTVLMSTYNGEKYIEEQIDSILNQQDVIVKLSVRDDGSSDQTRSILKRYELNYKNIDVVLGDNIGWKRSFFSLIENTVSEKDMYYAFSDQDDIWKKNKIKHALTKIPNNKPVVYHSNVTIVDESGLKLANRFSDDFVPSQKMPEAFLDSFALGCTMVFNSELMELTKMHIPKHETQHDAYVFALGYLLGEVVYDSETSSYYRRHNMATSGFQKISKNGTPSLIMRYKKYKKGSKSNFSIRAEELLTGYSELLKDNDKQILQKISFYKNNFPYKIRMLLSPKFKGTGLRRTLQNKFRVLMNTF